MVAPERVSLLCAGIYSRFRGCRLFACVGGVCGSVDNALFARVLVLSGYGSRIEKPRLWRGSLRLLYLFHYFKKGKALLLRQGF